MRTIILIYILVLSAVLFGAHEFALSTNLYWTTSWADIVTHTLGGGVVSGVFILAFSLRQEAKSIRFSHILLLTFVVGVLWEIFELVFGMTSYSDPAYPLDTSGDLFFDCLGAYISYLFLNHLSHE